ncbi:8-amino-7-oxononanoate synthase [Mucilaginibacter sp. BT774]|uniref:aminotransferase class I/II-fold pyridoxal phosphate-dependent enzyme n=1 Tax=Mucilaginibacter sp. BT774 TaxID=3062276 RepID=UPI0026758C7D|nr:8-amino-7-oxononanoate synthase [Mucilaginibacter sp. BT774]MDO3628761.1 8-amino-7-oxononanoate synthase [Mucilaginibacter sp. BT774]
MSAAEKFIRERLEERRENGSYRTLKPENNLVDFYSNDYLGFARSSTLKQWIDDEIAANQRVLNGSTGSRLLSGNLTYTETLERQIADYHKAEAGLIYNSGYDANIGLFSALLQRGDTIISDELIHASIIDGARLSYANRYTFRHNDLVSLEEKLKHAKGNCYVVIESVYSMDGDTPPIKEILAITQKYHAELIVDEAHAIGLYNNGLINKLALEKEIFARVVTFGKALGCHGAVVLGSKTLREYLINFSRSFIYTTAASFHQIASVRMAYKMLPQATNEIEKVRSNIQLFKKLIVGAKGDLLPSDSSIQCLVVGNNQKAKTIASELQSAGLDVRPILNPTVAKGSERLRICLHSFNSDIEITLLSEILHQYTL